MKLRHHAIRHANTALTLAATCLLTACGPGTLTVRSVPEGALISTGTQTLGISPYIYRLPSEDKAGAKDANGCYAVPSFTARWASGATASSAASPSICAGLKADYALEIARPAGVPGLDQDLNAANQREQVLARQREAQAIQNLANTEAINGLRYHGAPYYGPYWYTY